MIFEGLGLVLGYIETSLEKYIVRRVEGEESSGLRLRLRPSRAGLGLGWKGGTGSGITTLDTKS